MNSEEEQQKIGKNVKERNGCFLPTLTMAAGGMIGASTGDGFWQSTLRGVVGTISGLAVADATQNISSSIDDQTRSIALAVERARREAAGGPPQKG